MNKAEAIAKRAAWTYAVAFASVVAVIDPSGLWHVSTFKAAVGAGVIAVATMVAHLPFTPPEVTKGS